MYELTQQALGQNQWEQARKKHAQLLAQMTSHSGCVEPVNQLRQEQYEDGTARDIMQRALAECRRLHDRLGEGRVLVLLGYDYFAQQDYRSAIDAFQQQLVIAADADAKLRALSGLGLSSLAAGDHARALDAYTQYLQVASADMPFGPTGGKVR